jgi:hypothetical protein
VVAIDFSGHGESGNRVTYPAELLAEEALAAILTCAGGCASVVGHGYGGLPGAIAARIRPDLVNALVLVDPDSGSVVQEWRGRVECPVAIVKGEPSHAPSGTNVIKSRRISQHPVPVTSILHGRGNVLVDSPGACAGAIAGTLASFAIPVDI